MSPTLRVATLSFVLWATAVDAKAPDFENGPISTDNAGSLVFSPDGKGVYIADSNGAVRFWDLATGEVQVRIKGLSTKESDFVTTNIVCVGRDGRHALNAYGSGEIRYVDLSTGGEVWQIKLFEQQLRSLSMSPDGKLGLTSDNFGRLVLFSATDGQVVWDFKHNRQVMDTAFSASGDLLFEGESGRFRAETLEGYLGPFDFDVPGSGYASFGDVDVAKTGVVAAAQYHEVHLYDGKTGKRLRVVNTEGKLSANIVAISDDGKRFLTELDNGQAGLFDARSGKQIGSAGASGELLDLDAMDFAPDGRRFVIADDDGRISLWNTKGPKKVATARLWTDGYVVYLPDGAFISDIGETDVLVDLDAADVSKPNPAKVKAALAR